MQCMAMRARSIAIRARRWAGTQLAQYAEIEARSDAVSVADKAAGMGGCDVQVDCGNPTQGMSQTECG